ncbi:hypothetical protein BSB_19530 [Bacillus stercoris]|nr:hypothetical protein MY9_0557 [Bacillus sp. JS]BBA72120.1 hypothetical protein [Bacillus sp. FW1]BEV38880.1 hypothetical protein BSB_19530 [Bacillus stercoris]GFM15280.1 hypothetical protein FW1_contig-07-86 [Bacillus sp. FW1]
MVPFKVFTVLKTALYNEKQLKNRGDINMFLAPLFENDVPVALLRP